MCVQWHVNYNASYGVTLPALVPQSSPLEYHVDLLETCPILNLEGTKGDIQREYFPSMLQP